MLNLTSAHCTAAAPLAVDDTFPQPPSGPTTVPGPGVLPNDTIPCGTAAKLSVTKQPRHGRVERLLSSGGFTYDPYDPSGPNQADYFTYQVECPNGLVSEATVFLPGERAWVWRRVGLLWVLVDVLGQRCFFGVSVGLTP